MCRAWWASQSVSRHSTSNSEWVNEWMSKWPQSLVSEQVCICLCPKTNTTLRRQFILTRLHLTASALHRKDATNLGLSSLSLFLYLSIYLSVLLLRSSLFSLSDQCHLTCCWTWTCWCMLCIALHSLACSACVQQYSASEMYQKFVSSMLDDSQNE